MKFPDPVVRAHLLPAPTQWQPTTQRLAAVLAPLFEREGADWLLFTVRDAGLPLHAGQVSFPGGAREAAEDPIACALRETREEIGVPVQATTVLGGLPQRASSSGFCVHVVVGRIPDPIALRPDPREVARLLAVPLDQLLEAERWQERQPPSKPGGRVLSPSPHFEFQGEVIWGLTGRIAFDLVQALRQAR